MSETKIKVQQVVFNSIHMAFEIMMNKVAPNMKYILILAAKGETPDAAAVQFRTNEGPIEAASKLGLVCDALVGQHTMSESKYLH